MLVVAGVIGFVTWSGDQCTVYPGRPFQANVTLQGWGATQQCSQLTTGSVNGVVRLATLGLAGATQAAPSGEIICSGFSGLMHYTVRDSSITGTYVVGRSMCESLQQNGSAAATPAPS